MNSPMISCLARNNILLCFLLLLAPTPYGQQDKDFPEKSSTIVSDYTNTLSSGEQQSLERKLVAFNDSTSTQIAVVMLVSTGNYDIADYSVQLFNRWKIGQAKNNNGVLILVAKGDRKVWITTGYGIEGVLPDVLCKRIVEKDITPNFKQGDFYAGLDQATNSIMSIVKGEYTADQYMKKKDKPVFFPIFIFLLIIVV